MTKARDLANAADVLDDVSATELSYVNGVTSAIQTQLNAKQATVANVNDTEIGYLDGVTSAIQTQLDAKVAKSLVDAKGDLLVGSANDTVSRLAVASTAGYVLTVDSAEATGLKWAAAASSSGPAFRAYFSGSTQTCNANVATKITMNAENFDTDGNYDPTTNYRFTPTKAGYYNVNATAQINTSADTLVTMSLYKNGAGYSKMWRLKENNLDSVLSGSDLVYLNGSTDYIEVYMSPETNNIGVIADSDQTYWSAHWVRS